jgi:alanyl aminopeptidase
MKKFVRLPTALALLSLLPWVVRAEEGRLDSSVRPLKQSVYLKVDPAQDNFSGSTHIPLKLERATRKIRLHALDIQVAKAELRRAQENLPLTIQAGETVVSLLSSKTLPPGQYTLVLSFTGPFNRHSAGLYKFTDQGLPYLSSQFEMTDARRCFPCFDEPCFKIPYQLTVEAPKGQAVYNNCAETARQQKGNQVVHTFAATEPIPSYLVALAVGPYQQVKVPGLGVPGSIVSPQGKIGLADFARRDTPPILKTLENYFGIPYPYHKLDQLAITEFPFGAMENPGMVTYREDTILVNPATAQLRTRVEVSRTIAHEFAHMWFGNLVTMKWWDDLWLNEAFAEWMAHKVTRKLHPEYEVELETSQNQVMGVDANLTTRPIRKPITNESNIMDGLFLAYAKGSAVLNMVERWLGEDTFRQGMRAYMRRHRFGNAEAADLWNELKAVSGKDVPAVLRSFTSQSGYPMLAFSLQGTTLKVSQRRFLNAGVKGPEQSWAVPLFVRYGAGKKEAVSRLFLQGKSLSAPLEFQPDWIFPDDGGVGYFRWELSKPQLDALLAHQGQLSNREKIALIHNLNSLFAAGTLSAGDNLGALSAFASDAHPSVAGLALTSLASRRLLFVDQSNQQAWKNYLQPVLAPLVKRVGLTPRAGESVRVQDLRPTLLEFMARDLADADLIATAQQKARAFLEGKPVEPALIESYLRIAASTWPASMPDQVKKALVEAKDPQRRTLLLGTLGLFGQAEAQNRALDLMLDEAVTASDLQTLLVLNVSEEARRLRLQQWLEKNYLALKAKLPSAFLNTVVACLAGCRDRENLDSIKRFYSSQADPEGVLKNELAKLQESVENAIATRERGQASFHKFLSGGH